MESISTPFLILIGAILLVYFGLLVKFSSTIKNSIFLEKLAIVFFILLIAGGWEKIYVFSKLNPSVILTQGSPPGVAFTAIVIAFSASLFSLNVKLRASSKVFSNGLVRSVLHNPFLVALIFLTPISAFWSITPLFTFARAIVFIGVITTAVYVGSCYQWKDILNFLKWGFAFAIAQSTFIALVMPSIGVQGKGWQGAFDHAGILGLYASLTALLWLINLFNQKEKRLFSLFVVGLSIFVMLQTNSSTGLLLFIQGVCLVLVVNQMKKLKSRTSFVIMVNSLPILILISQGANYYFTEVLVLLDKSPSLTGRGEFWPQLIQKIDERPMLGYGFEGFWLPWKGELNPAASIINSNFYVPQHAHNGFLDLALSLGIVGLILYVLTFVSCIVRIFKSIRVRRDSVSIPLVLLLFITVANASGNGLWEVGFHSFLFVLISTRVTLDSAKPQHGTRNVKLMTKLS